MTIGPIVFVESMDAEQRAALSAQVAAAAAVYPCPYGYVLVFDDGRAVEVFWRRSQGAKK